MQHTVEIKKYRPTNNAREAEAARYFAECSCGWNGNRRDTFALARGDGNEHETAKGGHTERPGKRYSRFSNPEYEKWMHWEDFIHFVVRAKRPYTRRDVVTVLQNYGEGMQQSGFTQSEAEDEMEDVRAQIEEEAFAASNQPTS